MWSLSDEATLALLRRAGFRCEYCGRSLEEEMWHRDHIVPVVNGGSNGPENLAATCPRCNTNKGPSITAVDPLTLRHVPLFNPRRDSWDEHFRPLNHFVAGRTEVGRATATLLFRQTAQAQHFVPMPLEVGAALLHGSEAVYLRWLYGQRKAAQFDILAKELASEAIVAELERLRDSLEDGACPGTSALLLIERAAVLAEMVTSRCLVEDLLLGERLCLAAIAVCSLPRLAAKRRLPYFQAKRALVWRQLAVVCATCGAWRLGKACLRLSYRLSPFQAAEL